MSSWMLNYLFYVGIVLPTVVTLALFIFFVICWRRQSARKAVLTKPYDPHGAMRRLGIPNRPPRPPVFIRPVIPSLQREDVGGEDNAAYDMSRSPSAEAQAGSHLNGNRGGALEIGTAGEAVHAEHRPQLGMSGGGEGEAVGRLSFHHRLDSGLSEPTCDSPLALTSGAGEGGGGDARERPQSQNSHTSHSSHSTDSEDSGFRSSRSGPLSQTAVQGSVHDPPGQKRSRSGGRGQGGGQEPRAGSCSPDSEGPPPIQLTPAALWADHPHLHLHHHHPYPAPQHRFHPTPDGPGVTTTGVDLADIGAHMEWRYLQHLTYAPYNTKVRLTPTFGPGPANRPPATCQRLRLAQGHPACDHNHPEVLGFSVV